MQKNSVVSDTFEKLSELAKDSAQAVATEPLAILKQALGVQNEQGQSTEPLEQGTAAQMTSQTQPSDAQKPTEDPLLTKKKLDDKERTAKLLALHRQRLKEEEIYFQQSQTEKVHQEKLEEEEHKQKQQEEIMQIERQNAKDAVLNAQGMAKGPQMPGAVKQAQKLTGTKEIGKSKAD